MITIALADDHDIVRAGLKCVLQEDSEIQVIGEASDGATAIMLAAKNQPDILFMDLSMPPFQSGLSAIAEVMKKSPRTKIIVFTMFSDADYLRYSISNGASGYLIKNASADEILDAVHKVFNGERYIHPSLEALANFDDAENDEGKIEALTPRELEILRLLAAGHTNREMSDLLYLSVKTIEAHRAKLYSKMRFQSRAELVEYALKHGLLNGSTIS